MVQLADVVIVAAVDQIPDVAALWPARVLRAADCSNDEPFVYLCGRSSDVQPLISRFKDGSVLGLLVDDDSISTSIKVEVLDLLRDCPKDGFSHQAWEQVLSTVCAKHDETIQDMIAQHVHRSPDKLALVFEDKQWTFRQVLSMACSFVDELKARAIEPSGGVLAVEYEISDSLVVCYLGLYLGRYLFQVVDAIKSSREYFLDVCPCQAYVCKSGNRDCLEHLPVQLVFLDQLELDATRALDTLQVAGELKDKVFIEYTSGSTGKPKAVAVTQRRIGHWVRWRHFHFPLSPGHDRVAYNLFFPWYWHITMAQGGVTVIWPTALNHDVSSMMRYLGDRSVHRVDCLTPGLISAALDVEENLPVSFKMVISGGEALPMATCREWLRRWPHIDFWNNLATTETAADISFCHITPEVAAMDLPFAPISDGILVWRNSVEVINDELVISGLNVEKGYLPPTVSDKFTESECGFRNTYSTGDRAKWMNGKLFLLGRLDSVVKIRGHRVDLAGLEASMDGCVEAKDIAFVALRDAVWAAVVTEDLASVQKYAEQNLAQAHLVVWRCFPKLPYTPSAKRDRQRIKKLLEASFEEVADNSGGAPLTEKEKLVADAWQSVLGRAVGREEPFLQAGGHSLSAMKLAKKLGITPAEIFAYPTIATLTAHLYPSLEAPLQTQQVANHFSQSPIGIVGMAGRFPGAPSVDALWEALVAGKDLISALDAGPNHVPRKGIVPDSGFDLKFWDISKESAAVMDVAQRTMLEVAYEALEDAGLNPFNVRGRVGVVVCGGSLPHYTSDVLKVDLGECRTERPDEYFAHEIGADKDYLATQISYRLNLHGPSEVVQTACSSGLVAVVRAMQLLRLHACDYVICGGASFSPDAPVRKVDGMIWSPDGTCRPFAEAANGTVNSDGCGLVVLTRLDAAQQRGERVYASVMGGATNNDGARKAGFSAPSLEGQVEVIKLAHESASIQGSDVEYIEAHGTATKLGDPLELLALTEALQTKRKVLLGSVKGNIGHMNTAAGIPGFIKTALMLHHQRMVPSIHAENVTSAVDWEQMPLHLSQQDCPWDGRVAGVSSFGIGGTNAHVILGAHRENVAEDPKRTQHLFVASAKTSDALAEMQQRLAAEHSRAEPMRAEATLLSRPPLLHRCFALGLDQLPRAKVVSSKCPVILLFPGQGGAYEGMGASLEKDGLLKRDWENTGPADIVKASLAIADSLQRQGLTVAAVIGHSVGEWAAAAFAGAVPVDDAVRLAAVRGNLMETMESGVMLSVRATPRQVEDLLKCGVEMACVNGAQSIVLAGPEASMEQTQVLLTERGLTWKRLQTKHAFHTAAVDNILEEYKQALGSVAFAAPKMPVLSNVTGNWHGVEPSTAEYWTQHLRQPVRFLDNLRCLASRFPKCVVVEVGPSVLSGVVAREAVQLGADWTVLPTMQKQDEVATYLRCIGNLWAAADLKPDLPVGAISRTSLPTYPFQRVALPSHVKQLVAQKHNVSAELRGRSTASTKSAGASIRESSGSSPEPSSAPQGGLKNTRTVHDLFYKECLERTEVNCSNISEAVVILDGDTLPLGLPPSSIVASRDRAVVAAQASGCLIFAGVSDAGPTLDDTSQDELVKNITSLLEELIKAKTTVQIFFVLQKNLRYAAIWGLLRSAAREHPELNLRRILREEGASLVFPVLPGEFVLRLDGAYIPRLCKVAPPRVLPDSAVTYNCALVTGGLRGLGTKVAQWLAVTQRARSIVLVGRNEPKGEALETIERLRESTNIKVCLCDVSQWAEVQRLPDCDLVIHAAGNVKDGLLLHASPEDIQKVMWPKVRGAVHLKERFPGSRLVGFSSSSGVFGTAGQATYAAANTFLDAVMQTVQWGGWGEAGMAKDLDIPELPGERFMPVAVGLQCLQTVLDAPKTLEPICVLDVVWDSYRRNPTIFAPDDPLLASIGAKPVASILGRGSILGDRVRSWEVTMGPEGSRHQGTCVAWEVCQQHVVVRTPIFPGTAFVALGLAAVQAVGLRHASLVDVTFARTLELDSSRLLTTTLVQNNDGGGSLRWTSRPIDGGAETVHCTCNFVPASPQPADLLSSKTLSLVPSEELYSRFAAVGFNYGPAFRALEVCHDATNAQCSLQELPGTTFPLHPAVLDAAMHMVSLIHPLGCRGAPRSFRKLSFHSDRVPTSARACNAPDHLNVQLFDATGRTVCWLEGVEFAALDAPPALQLRQPTWRQIPPEPRGIWMVHGEEAAKLHLTQTTCCADDAHDAVVFAVHARTLEDVQSCRQQARALSARKRCWVIALHAPFCEAAAAAAIEVGAQAVVGSPEDVCKVAMNLGVAAPLVRAQDGKLFEDALEQVEARKSTIPSSEPYAVSVNPSLGAKGAQCRLAQRRDPQPHEVEVRTDLWALNFRDVLVAVGAIPMETAGQSLGIGGECYGEVVQCGSAVQGLAPGDKVIAVPPDGMGSFATIDGRWVAPAPSMMSPEDAVAGTAVYATAWLGLRWMARIGKGESVLIHSAAGGVGLAAVHLCLREGCTVFGTASTPEKRAYLLSLGVSGVFDSRNIISFEQGIRAATDGEGIDVVLNSLGGDAIVASLKLLKPFGRFIELGKRDQYEDTRVGLGPFLSGLTYAAAHFDVLMLKYPDRCRKLLEEVWGALPELPRLPSKTFPISHLPGALEYFSKGTHIGKILVAISDTPVAPSLPNMVSGLPGDAVAQALRSEWGAQEGPDDVVCIPKLDDLTSMPTKARLVLTASGAVAAAVGAACPGAVCVKLPRWEPVSGVESWLSLQGNFVAVEEEKEGHIHEWLTEVVMEMAGPIQDDQTFESAGLDSLALISLARRLSTKVGRGVSVVDLYDNPTPERLLASFSGGPKKRLLMAKVVALHGFRSNAEALQLSLAPFVSAVGSVEWVFMNSPRKATGPSDPKIAQSSACEWWGCQGGDFETGWMAPHFDGLEESLAAVTSLAPMGVVGFSQGGGVAALVECSWMALFSAVVPPGLKQRSIPSFHSYDLQEEYVSQCMDVAASFQKKEVHEHHSGHNIPSSREIVEQFVAFVSRNMQSSAKDV